MKGHTENRIFIRAPRNYVYKVTNNLSLWTEMFTEYENIDILKQEENYFEFRLTTYPDEKGERKTWISWRRLFPSEWRIEAARITTGKLFSSMEIKWDYLESDDGTTMIWVQDFVLTEDSIYTSNQVEDYINQNSKLQMQAISQYLVRGWENSLTLNSKQVT